MSSRTADYLAALSREGDKFDYWRWLQQVRAEETQSKELQQTITVRIVPPKINASNNALSGVEGQLLIRSRVYREPLRSTSSARITRRFEKIHDARDEFQSRRARDAVYGYLEAVFAIVRHYKVRRKTKKLLQHACKGARLTFDQNADPFSAVIRCTSAGAVDNKTISKWARALPYVAHRKTQPAHLKTLMKEAGGVNACASLYAQRALR
jgi:hypothetical protein